MKLTGQNSISLLPNKDVVYTARKMKSFMKDIFSKCDQICGKLRVWSHLLKKSLMKNFIFMCSFGKNNLHSSGTK